MALAVDEQILNSIILVVWAKFLLNSNLGIPLMPSERIESLIRAGRKPVVRGALFSEMRSLIELFGAQAFTLKEDVLSRPIYGTTLYLETCLIEMSFGFYKAYIFQDIISKEYMIALTHGDVGSADSLHVRLHSSCLTSETLRACDCDCAQQLETSLRLIVSKGSGIVFYLMQEGRGGGFVSKARDRMLVQATEDQISTFDAYCLMGLKRDYRQYSNIKDMCLMLKIQASFILLTNNPDKVAAIKEKGIKIERTESLEIKPGPYNLAYLKSKMESGHILKKQIPPSVRRIDLPHKIVPFAPYALQDAKRFIYVAHYFLPVRPVGGEIVLHLKEDELKLYFKDHPIDYYIEHEQPLIKSYSMIRNNRIMVKIHEENMAAYQKEHPQSSVATLLTTPYWFHTHVYFDTITNEDFIVLTYGDLNKEDSPVTSLYNESIFNRFPLKHADNRSEFKKTTQSVVCYGSGVIIVLSSDGRDVGFGVQYDTCDYEAAITLLAHHTPGNRIQMVMHPSDSLAKKQACIEALKKNRVTVDKWL